MSLDAGQVESELQLGGTGLAGWLREDAGLPAVRDALTDAGIRVAAVPVDDEAVTAELTLSGTA